MDYNASTDQSPEKHAEFTAELSAQTVTALQQAQGKNAELENVIRNYVATAKAANISLDEMENLLGIKEPSIMDLAELSESDEETVISMFEKLTDL